MNSPIHSKQDSRERHETLKTALVPCMSLVQIQQKATLKPLFFMDVAFIRRFAAKVAVVHALHKHLALQGTAIPAEGLHVTVVSPLCLLRLPKFLAGPRDLDENASKKHFPPEQLEIFGLVVVVFLLFLLLLLLLPVIKGR
eukprot:jgi/Botrbrau1/3162/Bobra.0070s0127.1